MIVTVGVSITVVCVMALVVCFVGYKRLKAAREAPANMDAIAPYIPEGGLKLSKNKSRAQAIQEQRSQMFRERARFAATQSGSTDASRQLMRVEEGREMEFTSTDASGESTVGHSTTVTPRSVVASATLYRALVNDSDNNNSSDQSSNYSSGYCSSPSASERSGAYMGTRSGSASAPGGSMRGTTVSSYTGGGDGLPQRSSTIIVAKITL